MDLLKGEPFWTVRPKAAYCIKAIRIPSLLDSKSYSAPVPNNSSKQKVFLNVCTCDELPEPKHISEQELAEILESDNPGSYKIPLSLGDLHHEVDKSGSPCLAYDVIVNGRFFEESVKSSELFRTFLALICIDALYDKYQVQLDKRNWAILKHRKHVGEIKPQNIRQKAKPLIEELDSAPIVPSEEETTAKPEETEEWEEIPQWARAEFMQTFAQMNKYAEPDELLYLPMEPGYEIKKDTARNPTKLIGQFLLPLVQSSNDIKLQVSEDGRILLTAGFLQEGPEDTEIKKYFSVEKLEGAEVFLCLDIYVPYRLRPNDVTAVYYVDWKTLIVKFPLS